MKKFLFILLCVLLMVPSIIVRAAQQVTRQPNFFMPAGVWENRHTKVKVPPITQMRFRSETPPIVLEMRRQDIEAAKKRIEERRKALEEQKKTAEAAKQEDVKIKTAETVAEDKKGEIAVAIDLPQEKDDNPVMLPQTPPEDISTEAQKVEKTVSNPVTEPPVAENDLNNVQPEAVADNSDVETGVFENQLVGPDVTNDYDGPETAQKQTVPAPQRLTPPKDFFAGFDQIFAEYQQDIRNLSSGKKVENHRLKSVLSQWNGEERTM